MAENEEILDSVPDEPKVEYVYEGTPEADELADETKKPAEPAVPQGKDELEAQLKELQAKMQMAETVLQRPQQVVLAPPPGPDEAPEVRKQKLNNRWMEDPAAAFEEQSRAQLKPVLDIMFTTQAALSKDLALAIPEQKEIYGQYKDEVEQEVARMSPQERVEDPRVYQVAIERVKTKHSSEITDKKVEELVNKRLQELGIDPKKKPAVFSPAGEQRTSSTQTPRREVIPVWVRDRAVTEGLDPAFLYEHLKEKGELKGRQ